MKPILQIQNVSKSYRISHERHAYLTMRDKLTGIFKRSEEMEEFWAIRDVSFDVMPGEAIGIIGRNGAGKSTLLKILSRITSPTQGNVLIRGRIASLLEVGTGFHQELTGRENIFMNGSVLGMKKTEIKAKFDEIVEFSGVEQFLDTPLKNFSSGMQLRLAFAVAAHLEPEILIVDEVLAVGDAEFQKKCLGKMDEVSKNQGRTILFVSHNMSVVKSLCSRCLVLKGGTKDFEGRTEDAVARYQNESSKSNFKKSTQSILNLVNFRMLNKHRESIESFNMHDHVIFELEYHCTKESNNVSVAVCFNNTNGARVISLWSQLQNKRYNLSVGVHTFEIAVPKIKLIPGVYEAIVYIEMGGIVIERLDNFRTLVVGFTENDQYVQPPTETLAMYSEDYSTKLIQK